MQVRVPEDDLAELLRRLCSEEVAWSAATSKYEPLAAPPE